MGLPLDNLSTVEDFLENDAFRAWVLERRLEDQLYWHEWLNKHPEKRDVYEQAVATLIVLQGKTVDLSEEQVKEKTQDIVDQLVDTSADIKPLLNWQWGRWAAAAAIVCLLVWWQLDKAIPNQSVAANVEEKQLLQDEGWKVVKNITNQSLVVLLPDNSSVLLSAGSQLRFRKQMPDKLREVFLQGEGFFEVAKNPTRPFIVYTANLTTKVLGTSFQVRSFENEATAYVKVKTGTVSVTPVASPEKTVLLAMNEQLKLETKITKVGKQEHNNATKENTSEIVTQQFAFEFTPVPEVLDLLETSYHMPIRYNRELFRNCTFTGQLNDVPFMEKIRLICLTVEADFEVIDNQVYIHGHGCN